MTGITLDALGLTKEDLIDRVAQRIADDLCDGIEDRVSTEIFNRVNEATGQKMDNAIDKVLSAAMTKMLDETVTPVNLWGEKRGEPTTIRDALAERAKNFWLEKVDKDGRTNAYGGTPRHEVLMRQFLNDEFENAIRQNAAEIVLAFRTAVREDAIKLVDEHIQKLIPVRTR